MLKHVSLHILCLLFISQLFAQNASLAEGKYSLFRQDDPAEKTGEMIITSWKEDVFLIRGTGWIGQGEFREGKGFYEWKFDDGRTGRTVVELNSDGTLSGHVIGSGINWKYVARKVKSP